MYWSLTSALYLVGFVQSTYLLLTIPSHRGRVLLWVFLSAMILLMANYIVWQNGWLTWPVQFWLNRFTHTSLTYLLGPSLYLYLRLNTEPTFQLNRRHLWHAVPYILALLLSIFVFPRYLPIWREQTSQWLLPADTWPQLLRSLNILVYVRMGGRLLWLRALQQPVPLLRRRLTGAILLTGGSSMAISTGAFLLPDTNAGKQQWEAVAVVCSVGMLYLLNRLLFEQSSNSINLAPVSAIEPEAKPDGLAKYQRSALNAETASALFERLDRHIINSRAYEEPELTLSQLARALGVSANQLSQAINQVGGQTFYELTNRHRVREACRLLTDSKHQHLSVSGIGYEVGFRSKSTFYAAFRRERGMTPSVYRKQAKLGK
ncbi:helix-turn-helix transcriptional regulator [Spirosoma arcticum]